MLSFFLKRKTTPVTSLNTNDSLFQHKCKTTNAACCVAFKQTTVDYCSSSCIHGLKDIGNDSCPIIQRWFWLLSFGLSISAVLYLMVDICLKYKNRSLVTVFDSAPRPLQEIPFPTVTFCNPKNTISKDSFDNYARQVLKMNPDSVLKEKELKILAKTFDIINICQTFNRGADVWEYIPKLEKYYLKYKANLDLYSNRVQTAIDESYSCQDLIRKCTWGGSAECRHLFVPAVTEKGYCCVFNGNSNEAHFKNFSAKLTKPGEQRIIDLVEWFELDPFEYVPSEKKLQLNGILTQTLRNSESGLIVTLNHTFNSSFCSPSYTNGTEIHVHSKLEFSTGYGSNSAGSVNSGNTVFFRVKPEITDSDPNTKFVSRDKRKCNYENETELTWYKHYTLSNCIEECHMLSVMEKCNCVPDYSGLFSISSVRTCNQSMLDCVYRNGKWKKDWKDVEKCSECFPPCTEIQYTTTMELSKTTSPEEASVYIYMDVDYVHPKLRKESVTIIQLFSNAVVVLGVFMGFNVLSFLELFYYGTLCYTRNRQRK